MKRVIIRTSAKHYAEKKLCTFALPPLRRRKLIKQARPPFLQFKAIQAKHYPSIHKYATASEMAPGLLDFARCFIAADWEVNIHDPHGFMITQKVWINSIIKN